MCWLYTLRDATFFIIVHVIVLVPNSAGPSAGTMMTIFISRLILTHWGRVTHICVSKLTIIGSDNGLSPGRRQAIIWTNAGILLFRPVGTNFSEILIEIHIFSFKKMHSKCSSATWRPFCLGLNVLIVSLVFDMFCVISSDQATSFKMADEMLCHFSR